MNDIQTQGSDVWLQFRHKHLGASDSPVIMNVSPWRTPYQLWEEKTSEHPPENKPTYIMQRGHDAEPKARALYEIKTGRNVPAEVVEYARLPYLSASLDGWDEEGSVVVEIKLVGEEVWHKVKNEGFIPVHYMPQLQHQLLVTGARRCDFVAYCDELGKIAIVEVSPDIEYIGTPKKPGSLLGELAAFWKLVTSKTPPPLTDKDFKVVRDDGLKELITEWAEVDAEMHLLKHRELELRDKIIELSTHKRLRYRNVKICKYARKGSVNYAKIPELRGVDLDKYRKDVSYSWRFTAEKKD